MVMSGRVRVQSGSGSVIRPSRGQSISLIVPLLFEKVLITSSIGFCPFSLILEEVSNWYIRMRPKN